MKKSILFIFILLSIALNIEAKNIKKEVFTPTPKMVCNSCENKIVNGLRFEKGIKDVETDLKAQTVSVKFDADKTSVENIQKSFEKIGYKAELIDQCIQVCPDDDKESECKQRKGEKTEQKAKCTKNKECCNK